MLKPRVSSLGPLTKVRHITDPLKASPDRNLFKSTLRLGAVAGPIFCIILVVDCLFFQFLEWLIPRSQLDFVDDELTNSSTVFDRFVICLSGILIVRN